RPHRLEHRLAPDELHQEIHVLIARHGERIGPFGGAGAGEEAIPRLRGIAHRDPRDPDRGPDGVEDQALALGEKLHEPASDDAAAEEADANLGSGHRSRRLPKGCGSVYAESLRSSSSRREMDQRSRKDLSEKEGSMRRSSRAARPMRRSESLLRV